MRLHQVTPQDHKQKVVAPVTLAELKALVNALTVDAATSPGSITPGVHADKLIEKVNAIIANCSPPKA